MSYTLKWERRLFLIKNKSGILEVVMKKYLLIAASLLIIVFSVFLVMGCESNGEAGDLVTSSVTITIPQGP